MATRTIAMQVRLTIFEHFVDVHYIINKRDMSKFCVSRFAEREARRVISSISFKNQSLPLHIRSEQVL